MTAVILGDITETDLLRLLEGTYASVKDSDRGNVVNVLRLSIVKRCRLRRETRGEGDMARDNVGPRDVACAEKKKAIGGGRGEREREERREENPFTRPMIHPLIRAEPMPRANRK